MRATSLLIIGAAWVRLCQSTGKRWHCIAQVPAQVGMLGQILPLLPTQTTPLTVILDLPEQDYLIEPLPTLNKRDITPYLHSRARQLFPGRPGGSGQLLPGAPAKAVFGGASPSSLVSQLLDDLASAGCLIGSVGFYTDIVAGTATKASGQQLWILPGLGGGVRHVLIQDGLALFTRLCQEIDEHGEEVLAQDIANSCTHLDSRMLLETDQPLPVHVARSLTERAGAQFADALLALSAMPPYQLLVEPDRANDWARLVQRKTLARCALSLPASLRQRQQHYQLARWLAVASGMVTAFCTVYCVLLLMRSMQMRAEIAGLSVTVRVASVPKAESDARIDQAALQLFRKYPADTPDMESALQSLSMVLLALPQLQLEEASWERADEADTVAIPGSRQLHLTLIAGDSISEAEVFNRFQQKMLEQGATTVTRSTPMPMDAHSDTGAQWHWLAAFAPPQPGSAQ